MISLVVEQRSPKPLAGVRFPHHPHSNSNSMNFVKKENDYGVFHNHRKEPYFTLVRNGQKTIEGRLCREWYAKIAPGDHVVVFNEDETDSFEVKVIAVRRYQTFKEMLSAEGISNILPNARSLDEGVAIYRQFYSEEQEQKFGVVAIEVRVI